MTRQTKHTAKNQAIKLRQQQWLLLFLIIGVGLFWSFTLRQGHVWGGDFSLYIHHALNLLNGVPYSETGYILNPADPVVSPQAYPPIFPLLLMPSLYFFGLNLTALKLVIVLCFTLFLAVYLALLRRELPTRDLVLLAVLVGFSPFFWDFKDDIRSDIPFLLFSYIVLYQIHRMPEKREGRAALVPALITGLFCYLAYGVRSVGVALPISLLIYDLLRWRTVTRFTLWVGVVLGIGVGLQALLFPGSDYSVQYIFDPATNAANVAAYFISLSTLWDNGYNLILLLVLSIVTNTLALTAVWPRIRRQPTILEIYLVVYLLILVIWPVSQGIRFLIPILPLYFFYVVDGLRRLRAALPKRWGEAVFWGITAVILFSYIAKYSTMPFAAIPTGVAQPDSVALFEYVKNDTAVSDVFIFRKPRVLALYTGRSAAIFHPAGATEAAQWAFWQEIKATYLIVSRWDEPHWQQFINSHQEFLQLTYANTDFRVYRILRFPEP